MICRRGEKDRAAELLGLRPFGFRNALASSGMSFGCSPTMTLGTDWEGGSSRVSCVRISVPSDLVSTAG